MSPTRKAIIIGAGPAGLISAMQLVKKGFQVEVIEKLYRLGGMCRSWKWLDFVLDVGHHAAKTHVVELGRLTAQTGFDVAQALPVGRLCEGHAQVLVETGEVFDLVLSIVASNAATESGQRQMRHDLRKNEFARVHEYAPQAGWKNRKCYGRRSNRDQPRTRNISFPSIRYTTQA
jgi:phytoene dehydrogenase-like protein